MITGPNPLCAKPLPLGIVSTPGFIEVALYSAVSA